MKKKTLWILSLGLALSVTARAATQEVLTVAVFDFESKDEAVQGLGPKVAAMVGAQLSAEPQIVTVERAELEKVLGEQELGLSGVVSPESAAKVGRLTGAKVLVTGRVFKADKEMIVVAKVISSETSRVYGAMVKGTASSSLSDLSGALAQKIAATVSEKAATLVARVPTHEERVARLKAALKDKPLPSVSVDIGERHFGQPVVDPAAQTELSLMLQQCGFALVDAHSTNKAQLLISGDAFSAYGMRKGNLISCKARLEVQVHKASGELVVVDRQTSMGVDIAEQTAAKMALQEAGAELAERLLPALVR